MAKPLTVNLQEICGKFRTFLGNKLNNADFLNFLKELDANELAEFFNKDKEVSAFFNSYSLEGEEKARRLEIDADILVDAYENFDPKQSMEDFYNDNKIRYGVNDYLNSIIEDTKVDENTNYENLSDTQKKYVETYFNKLCDVKKAVKKYEKKYKVQTNHVDNESDDIKTQAQTTKQDVESFKDAFALAIKKYQAELEFNKKRYEIIQKTNQSSLNIEDTKSVLGEINRLEKSFNQLESIIKFYETANEIANEFDECLAKIASSKNEAIVDNNIAAAEGYISDVYINEADAEMVISQYEKAKMEVDGIDDLLIKLNKKIKGYKLEVQHTDDLNNGLQPNGPTADPVGPTPDSTVPTVDPVGPTPDSAVPTTDPVGPTPDSVSQTADQEPADVAVNDPEANNGLHKVTGKKKIKKETLDKIKALSIQTVVGGVLGFLIARFYNFNGEVEAIPTAVNPALLAGIGATIGAVSYTVKDVIKYINRKAKESVENAKMEKAFNDISVKMGVALEDLKAKREAEDTDALVR